MLGAMGENWAALGEAVKTRRDKLKLRQSDLEARGGPGHGTVRNIEQVARTSYAPRTFAQLEQALNWPTGTVQKILNGTATEEDVNATLPMWAQLREHQRELMESYEAAHPLPAPNEAERIRPVRLAAELLASVAAFEHLDPAESELLTALSRAIPALRRRALG